MPTKEMPVIFLNPSQSLNQTVLSFPRAKDRGVEYQLFTPTTKPPNIADTSEPVRYFLPRVKLKLLQI